MEPIGATGAIQPGGVPERNAAAPDADPAGAGFTLFDTVIGHCGLAWNEHVITGVLLPEAEEAGTRRRMRRLHPGLEEVPAQALPPLPRMAIARIAALLRGERDDLRDLALDLDRVPPFHRRVYELVRAIGPGRTITYGEVAAQLGEPSAARAVGQALGSNPFAPVIPCHRVLAAGNRSGGFSAGGGVATKLRMLLAERARMGATPGLFD